ncbi:hypothetical protein DCS_00373 [Drechmeria coniospora]|uniref:Uncharacterized protein n=1 Tax=Drechmeria coniospora TaxID=98403 RepID=A0A151GQ72_DRECN|nr:hypothetical protein DCS_00373 [Drechmeria coniospora]KYK59243.1 hypothetical protein DCS_00373 [Drechmeria coniospora]
MGVDAEKMGAVDHMDKSIDNSSNSDVGHTLDPDAGLSEEERKEAERKLLWKLDLQLIPWV